MALSKDKFVEYENRPDGTNLFISILPNKAHRHFIFSVDKYGTSRYETIVWSTEIPDKVLDNIKTISPIGYDKIIQSKEKMVKNKVLENKIRRLNGEN